MPTGGPLWPGAGPYRLQRQVAAWPHLQFSYPAGVRLTQQFVEVVTAGDPAAQQTRLTQQFAEVVTAGDPTAQRARLTQQYIEVISSIPPTYSYVGARGGKWPGAGPEFAQRRIGAWPLLQFALLPPAFIDASPQLVGVHATGAVGTVTATLPDVAVNLAGVAATGHAGTVTPTVVVAVNLTGVAATAARNTFADTDALQLVGVAGHAAAGTLTPFSPDKRINLVGVAATGAVGSIGIGKAIGLVGVASTARAGTLYARHLNLTGQAGQARAGIIRPAIARSITGAKGTGAAGTVTGTLASIPRLTGVRAIGRAADLHTSIAVSGKGHGHGHGAQGSLSVTVVDVFATARAGTIGSSIRSATATRVNLTGVRGLAAFGTFGLSIGHQTALTPAPATAAIGSLAAALRRSLVGVPAAGHVGTPAARIAPSAALTGVRGTGAVNRLTVDIITTTAVQLGQPSAVAFSHAGQFTPAIARGLLTPAVNEAIGTAGLLDGQADTAARPSARAAGAVGSFGVKIDTIQPIFGVQAFSEAGTFRRDVSIALSAAAAQGRVGELTLALVLPQAPLDCELNATVYAANELNGAVVGNFIIADVVGNDLGGDAFCED